ncbi:MAG: enoyl-CoA hydratase-related protein [Gammaproteobacteria bacterium]|jgi:methylglutaconyl-CoA hydratase
MNKNILFSLSYENQVATVTLNRPEVYNAFDLEMILQLDQYFTQVTNDQNIKLLVITANGKHFSAGADLNWMRDSVDYTTEQNLQDAKQLATMLLNLYNLNKPVICAMQGSVYGGAIGIAACADLVIAANNCKFCFPEVTLGLAPAIISQFVLHAMNTNFAQYSMLTAKPFCAEQALQYGLVDEIILLNHLPKAVVNNIEHLLSLSFEGMIATKKLLRYSLLPISLEKLDVCVKIIAELRASTTAQSLIKKFLQNKS